MGLVVVSIWLIFSSSFFQVTFWSLKWRSLNPWKDHLKYPKRSLGRTWLLLFFCFWGSMGRGLLSMDKQSIRKTCRCPATPLLQKKKRTFGLGPSWLPPNKHNKFQYTVPPHIKSCTAHSGGGPRQKARLFVTGRHIWQRKPRFNNQGLCAWLWSGHLFICPMPVSNHFFRKTGRDMRYQYQIISNHLMDTESEFAPTLVRPTS